MSLPPVRRAALAGAGLGAAVAAAAALICSCPGDPEDLAPGRGAAAANSAAAPSGARAPISTAAANGAAHRNDPAAAVAGAPAAGRPRAGGHGACTLDRPCLAIVIDDIGRDMSSLRSLLELRHDLTFALLPHAPATTESLAALRARGREVLVHLPMAPREPSALTDEPIVISPDSSLETAVLECLARVPGARGASNHMGSLLTRDGSAMVRVLRLLGHHGLWFLDSRTTAESRGCAAARRACVPCIERDLFLDDPPAPAEVQSRLEQAVELALRRGWAVAIGHPQGATIRALARFVPPTSLELRRLSTVIAASAGEMSLDRATCENLNFIVESNEPF